MTQLRSDKIDGISKSYDPTVIQGEKIRKALSNWMGGIWCYFIGYKNVAR